MLNFEDRKFINYLYGELEYVYSKMDNSGTRLKKEGKATFSDVKSILESIGKSSFLASKIPESKHIGLYNLSYVGEEDVDIFKFISVLNVVDKLAHIFENRNRGFDFTKKFYSIKNYILDYVLERYPTNAFCIQTREDGTVNYKNAPYHIIFMLEDVFFSFHSKYQLAGYDSSNHRIAYIRFLKMLKQDKMYNYTSMDIEDIISLANHQLKEMQLEDKRFKDGKVTSYEHISYTRPNRRCRRPFGNEPSMKEWRELYNKKSPMAKAEIKFIYDIFNIHLPECIRDKVYEIFGMFLLKAGTLKTKVDVEKFVNETVLSKLGNSEEEKQYAQIVRETARRFVIKFSKESEPVFEGGASYDFSEKKEEPIEKKEEPIEVENQSERLVKDKKIEDGEYLNNLKQALLNRIEDEEAKDSINKLLDLEKGTKIKGIDLEKLVDMEILQLGSSFISPEMLAKAQRIMLTEMIQQASSKEKDLFELKNTKSGKIYLLVHVQPQRAKPLIYEVSSNISELCKFAGIKVVEGKKTASCNLGVLEKIVFGNDRTRVVSEDKAESGGLAPFIDPEKLDSYISGIVASGDLDRAWEDMSPEDKFGILSIVRQYISVSLFREILNEMNDDDKAAVMQIVNKYVAKPKIERSGPLK